MQPRHPPAMMGCPAPSKRQMRQNRSPEPGCKMRLRGFFGRMPGRPTPPEPGRNIQSRHDDGNHHGTRMANPLMLLLLPCLPVCLAWGEWVNKVMCQAVRYKMSCFHFCTEASWLKQLCSSIYGVTSCTTGTGNKIKIWWCFALHQLLTAVVS